MDLKLRRRHRFSQPKDAGRYFEWWEWQLVDGRTIVARFDFEAQALKYAAKNYPGRGVDHA